MPGLRAAAPIALLVAALLPAHGCCSLCRAWCGPDETPWFDPGLESPDQAVRTLLEAVRRERLEVLFASMTPGLKRAMGLPTVVEQGVLRERLDEEAPYLFMVGYASPGNASFSEGGERASYDLDVEGRAARLGFVRVALRRIALDVPLLQDDPVVIEDILPEGSFADSFRVDPGPRGGLVINGLPVALPDGLQVGPDQILAVEYRYEWRLDQLAIDGAP